MRATVITGLTVAERKRKLYPDRIGGELVGRGTGGVCGCERSSSVRFFFLTSARCSNQAENFYTREGTGNKFSLNDFFGFILIVFAVLLCRPVLPSLLYIQLYPKIKYVPCLGYVRTYRMRRSSWLPSWSMELLA